VPKHRTPRHAIAGSYSADPKVVRASRLRSKPRATRSKTGRKMQMTTTTITCADGVQLRRHWLCAPGRVSATVIVAPGVAALEAKEISLVELTDSWGGRFVQCIGDEFCQWNGEEKPPTLIFIGDSHGDAERLSTHSINAKTRWIETRDVCDPQKQSLFEIAIMPMPPVPALAGFSADASAPEALMCKRRLKPAGSERFPGNELLRCR